MSLEYDNAYPREIIDLVSDDEMSPTAPDGGHAVVDFVDLVDDPVLRPDSAELQLPSTPKSWNRSSREPSEGLRGSMGVNAVPNQALTPYGGDSEAVKRWLPSSDPVAAKRPKQISPESRNAIDLTEYRGNENYWRSEGDDLFIPSRPPSHAKPELRSPVFSPTGYGVIPKLTSSGALVRQKSHPFTSSPPFEVKSLKDEDVFIVEKKEEPSVLDPHKMSRKERNKMFKESLQYMDEVERGAAISYRSELDNFGGSLKDKAHDLESSAELATSSAHRGVYKDLADKYLVLSDEVREVFYDLQLRRYSEASVLDFIEESRERLREKNRRLQRIQQNFQASLNARPVRPAHPRAVVPFRAGQTQEDPSFISTEMALSEHALKEMENEYEKLLDKIHNNVTPMPMPPELDVSDLEHQRLGLGWLVGVEKGPNHGGILADDMGLGKTIQSIGLIYAHPPPENAKAQLTLIVCSTALLQTWFNELKDRVFPNSRKRVYIHHRATNGSLIMDPEIISSDYDVVITTYHTLLYETAAHSKGKTRPMPSIHWWRIILDEAHTIKNHLARTSVACASLRAVNRICLSGTPMQNNLFEIWSLIRFLRITPYWDNLTEFKRILPSDNATIKNSGRSQISQPVSSHGGQKFQTLLRMILLRRRKTTKINGRKILEGLPTKTSYRLQLKMDGEESETYSTYESGLISGIRRELSSTPDLSMSNILASLMRMRQQSCHPDLISITGYLLDKEEFRITEEDLQASLSLRENNKAQRIATRLAEAECSNCFSTGPADAGGLLVISPCCDCICGGCYQNLLEETDSLFPKCPSCDGWIKETTPLRVLREVIKRPEHSAHEIRSLFQDQFQQTRRRNRKNVAEWQQRVGGLVEALEDKIDMLEEDEYDNKYLVRGFEVINAGLEEQGEPELDNKYGDDDEEGLYRHQEIFVKSSAECERTIKYALDIDEVAAMFKVPGAFDNGWKSSAKIDTCMALLDRIWNKNPTDKVIIFSSFTSFLEIFTIPFTAARIPYAMYTGAMGVGERTEALDSFKSGIEKVLLISLKAGNVGLTLTSANHVILAEPFWNPYVEDQAKDRVYRIGQAKDVHVYSLFNQGTVEERIYEVQEKKRQIIGKALDSESTGEARVTRQDLLYMLGLGGAMRSR